MLGFPVPKAPWAASVILSTSGNARRVLLCREKALNALNLKMIRAITREYKRWQEEDDAKVIVMRGTGKGFCAGGDVRAIYDDGLAQRSGEVEINEDNLTKSFFREEYQLNNLIATSRVPQVALLNGITMGGGVGLSVHGKYRVCTEKTVFAMPETGIGFFPDVGGSFFLPRLPVGYEYGMFLALSGQRLKGKDLVTTGIATHFVPEEHLDQLEAELLDKPEQGIDNILSKYSEHVKNQDTSVLENIDTIKTCFAKSSVEAIVSALKAEGTEWSKKTADTLCRMAPISLKVTQRQLEEGSKMQDIGQCLKMEYRLTQHFMGGDTFYEGIRSVLVDKERETIPKWVPMTLEEVSEEQVGAYFEPLDAEAELRLA